MGHLVKHNNGDPKVVPGFLSPIFTPSLDDAEDGQVEDQLILCGEYGLGLTKDDLEALTHVNTIIPLTISTFKDCMENFFRLIRVLFTPDSELALSLRDTLKFISANKGEIVTAQKRAEVNGCSPAGFYGCYGYSSPTTVSEDKNLHFLNFMYIPSLIHSSDNITSTFIVIKLVLVHIQLIQLICF